MPQLQGQLPGIPEGPGGTNIFAGAVLLDTWLNAGLTAGNYGLYPLAAQPTLIRPWIIYSWSMQAQGVLVKKGSGTAAPRYGQLGKLFASLIVGSGVAPVGPSNAPFIPPPSQALQNLTPLWDGAIDPPFPSVNNNAGNDVTPPGGGFVQTVQALPIPQRLQQGEQIAIGLWLTPSLVGAAMSTGIGNQSIAIYNVSYSISYDTDRSR